MTKEKFLLYEKISKKMWNQLAQTGSQVKPSCMRIFLNLCPACSVANISCNQCPVDIWRNINTDDIPYYVDVNCGLQGELWYTWINANTITQRKKCAAKIASLKWTYNPTLYKQKNTITKTKLKNLLEKEFLE